MNVLNSAVSLGLLLFLVGCAQPDRDHGPAIPAPALADSETRVLTSAVTGRDYQVTVALPREYELSGRAYPVLYMVDANGQFGTMVETARQLRFEEAVPELIIVGIGYPVGRMWNAQAPRNVDLTPTSDPEWVRQRAIDYPQFPAPEGSGGASGFLRFIVDEVIPLVESNYRADPSDRALYGHSLGGLFGTYAMLQGEGAFNRFIVVSPSLWWDDRVIFEIESAYHAERQDLHARAFFSVGGLETHEQFRMVSNLEEFVSILEARQYEGFDFAARTFEEETHNTVFPRSVARGLAWIYENWDGA